MTSACLITDVPEFPPTERTPPFLVASSAEPALDRIHVVVGGEFEVSADVRSEDAPDPEDPESGSVVYKLLIDYGTTGSRAPYGAAIPGNSVLQPGTFDEADRNISFTWRGVLPEGCHTFTLMVSHAFRTTNPDGCPEDLTDSSELTWHAYVCGETGCPESPSCPATADPETLCYCPSEPNVAFDDICPNQPS